MTSRQGEIATERKLQSGEMTSREMTMNSTASNLALFPRLSSLDDEGLLLALYPRLSIASTLPTIMQNSNDCNLNT